MGLAVEVVEVAVFVAVEVVLLDALPDEGSVLPTMLVLLMIEQTLFPLPSVTQLYPKGQHLSPHVASLSPSLVVKIPAFGLAVAFWPDTSQDIGWMLSHEFVSGQQSADDELSSDMQLFPAGQVKLLGSFESTDEHDVASLLERSGNRGGFEL